MQNHPHNSDVHEFELHVQFLRAIHFLFTLMIGAYVARQISRKIKPQWIYTYVENILPLLPTTKSKKSSVCLRELPLYDERSSEVIREKNDLFENEARDKQLSHPSIVETPVGSEEKRCIFRTNQFRSSNIRNAIQFQLIREIGQGFCGKVYLAKKICRQPSSVLKENYYAVKIIDKAKISEKDMFDLLKAEKAVLQTVSHPFIVKLFYHYFDEFEEIMVMQLCPHGDLFELLKKLKKFTEPSAKFYLAQLTLAVGHLHQHEILYRDLKLENVGIDNQGYIKLLDFGLVKFGVKDALKGAQTLCGSPNYLAPEIVLNKGYGFNADWWALGILLFAMTTGHLPWQKSPEQDALSTMQNILHGSLKFPDSASLSLKQILQKLLRRNPQNRIGINEGAFEIQRDPYFSDIDWSALLHKEMTPPDLPTKKLDNFIYIENSKLPTIPRDGYFMEENSDISFPIPPSSSCTSDIF